MADWIGQSFASLFGLPGGDSKAPKCSVPATHRKYSHKTLAYEQTMITCALQETYSGSVQLV